MEQFRTAALTLSTRPCISIWPCGPAKQPGNPHPDEMLVLTICEFHSGAAANVFSDTAVMRGTIRTRNQKVREYARRRLEEISSTVASAFGASARVEYLYSGVPPAGK
ncbi:MAG: hypothetical protein ACLRZZ_14800 [Enterocloster sp.]